MELWFTEKQKDNLKLSCSLEQVLVHKRSEFQEIAVIDTGPLGRVLVIDGFIQVAAVDEFIYHEMIAHVPMATHPAPRDVLVIGGGDGGTVREVAKYPGVESITMIEIDREVVAASREFLPALSCKLDDSRVRIEFTDGLAFVAGQKNAYDVIIVDSTEPVGPAAGLFTTEFYQSVCEALKDEGIAVAQTESPFYNKDIIASSVKCLNNLFPVARLYLAPVPSYPGGLWSFALGSKKHRPDNRQDTALIERCKQAEECRYYTPEIHLAAFDLPPFISQLCR